MNETHDPMSPILEATLEHGLQTAMGGTRWEPVCRASFFRAENEQEAQKFGHMVPTWC